MTLEKKKKEDLCWWVTDVPWQRWPTTVVVEDEPFLFLEGSTIEASFDKF